MIVYDLQLTLFWFHLERGLSTIFVEGTQRLLSYFVTGYTADLILFQLACGQSSCGEGAAAATATATGVALAGVLFRKRRREKDKNAVTTGNMARNPRTDDIVVKSVE